MKVKTWQKSLGEAWPGPHRGPPELGLGQLLRPDTHRNRMSDRSGCISLSIFLTLLRKSLQSHLEITNPGFRNTSSISQVTKELQKTLAVSLPWTSPVLQQIWMARSGSGVRLPTLNKGFATYPTIWLLSRSKLYSSVSSPVEQGRQLTPI